MSSRSPSSLTTAPASARIPLILRKLGRNVQRPVHAVKRDPLDALIATVLSQNTTDANSSRAFAELKERFPDWAAVARSRPRQIASAIRSGGLANVKSRSIKRILDQIENDRGRLDLGFLADLPLPDARKYLTNLPGVGPKTAACVLLFALDRPAFPVDTHVLRVSKRLGLIPSKTTMDRAHDIFAEILRPQQVLRLHLGLIRHGRQVCIARRPRCPICELSELCPRIGLTQSAASEKRP